MACHCREDASTVKLITPFAAADADRYQQVKVCQRGFLPVVLVLRDFLTTTKNVIHCIFSSKNFPIETQAPQAMRCCLPL
jgi:hypothetical protein